MSDEDRALALAVHACELAVRCGADAAEATASQGRRFHAEARGTTIAKLERSTARALHVRVFAGSRQAALSTTDFSADGLREALMRTVDRARHVADDSLAGLPQTFAADVPDLQLFDAGIAERDDDAKVEEALELERLIRRDDSRVVNSEGSSVADADTVSALANSVGFAAAYRSTRASRASGPVAIEDGIKRVAHYASAGRNYAAMESAESVATTAARRAIAQFGAKKPQTMRVPVIFERDVAASVLDDVLSAVSAANVAVGNSWLAGRAGMRVGSELVTIVDDGRLPGKLGSAPFDGEGVATRRTVVFEGGVLRSFLYDTYYGRKLGAASTGNSTGGGVGATNFFLSPGAGALEDLIAATPLGVLVTDTIGFAHEHASGTYSRGARGFLIRGGELAHPIDEFTIAGVFAEMLAGIDRVADDLHFDGSVVSPSFRVAEMTVSGN